MATWHHLWFSLSWEAIKIQKQSCLDQSDFSIYVFPLTADRPSEKPPDPSCKHDEVKNFSTDILNFLETTNTVEHQPERSQEKAGLTAALSPLALSGFIWATQEV